MATVTTEDGTFEAETIEAAIRAEYGDTAWLGLNADGTGTVRVPDEDESDNYVVARVFAIEGPSEEPSCDEDVTEE